MVKGLCWERDAEGRGRHRRGEKLQISFHFRRRSRKVSCGQTRLEARLSAQVVGNRLDKERRSNKDHVQLT